MRKQSVVMYLEKINSAKCAHINFRQATMKIQLRGATNTVSGEAPKPAMLVNELTMHASLDVLARTSLGRLACSQGMQPYIVPIHFAYKNNCLYSFSMPGQKIDWMRANPLVCVEADRITREQWTTVVAFGRYGELFDTSEMWNERALAVELLQHRAEWWEPGSAKISQGSTPPVLVPIFYRISIEKISGRSTSLEPGVPDPRQFTANSTKRGWLHRLLGSSPAKVR